MSNKLDFHTGDVVLADFSNGVGHQQQGTRPAVVVSNNIGNAVSPTIEVLPITTKRLGTSQPTHVDITANKTNGLKYNSTVEAECKMPINKFQVIRKLGVLNEEELEQVAIAMLYSTPIIIKAFNKGVHHTRTFKRAAQ